MFDVIGRTMCPSNIIGEMERFGTAMTGLFHSNCTSTRVSILFREEKKTNF